MRAVMRWGVRLLALGLLAVVGLAVHSWYFRPLSARIFYERVFIQTAVESPEMISSMRLLPGWLDWTTDELDDYSLAAGDRGVRQLEDALGVRLFDRSTRHVALTAEGLKAFETMAEGHEAEVARLFAALTDDELDQIREQISQQKARAYMDAVTSPVASAKNLLQAL